jgi:hypothetical protein
MTSKLSDKIGIKYLSQKFPWKAQNRFCLEGRGKGRRGWSTSRREK